MDAWMDEWMGCLIEEIAPDTVGSTCSDSIRNVSLSKPLTLLSSVFSHFGIGGPAR